MKPLNWALGLLLCLFGLSFSASAQDSSKDLTRSASAITITAYVKPALIAQIYDSQGRLENSATRIGGIEKAVLTLDASTNPELTLKTVKGFLYLRRIEIAVRFSGFKSELGMINLSGHLPPGSATMSLVEGSSPDSVIPVELNNPKLVSDTMRTGNRNIRYVGFLSRLPVDLSAFRPESFQLRYEISFP